MKKSTLVELPNSISHYKYYLLLITIVLLVFGNSISNGYNMDDNLVTQNHPLTSQKSFSALYDIFTSPYYKDNMGNSYGYRPVVLLSFFLEHSIFAESSIISHFFNLFFYAIAVVLFFILLVSWFGEKGLVLGLLSALLFAVHPIHTEVVASIKNRDEILAFFFVILSGLAIEKYLKTNTWISLISILVFFTLGMLSKKSIFPMMVILPIGMVLFKEINLKQLTSLSLALILPAAIIGSNLEFNRLILISSMPLMVIFFIYYLKTGRQLGEIFDKRNTNILIFIISWFFLIISIWQKTHYITILFLGFSMFVVQKNESWTIVQLVLQLAILSFFLDSNDFSIAALFISLSYFIQSFNNNKPDRKLLYLSVIMCLFFIIKNLELQYILALLVILLFFYFIFRKSLWGLYYALAAFIGNVMFFGLALLNIFMLTYSVLYFVNSKKKNHHFESISTSIILVIILVNLVTPLTYSNSSNNCSLEQSVNSLNTTQQIESASVKNFMLEGRKLEYVENTLIVPHTLAETIGTGFITIGTYFKLMLFPKELSFYYGYAKVKTAGLNNWGVWLSILIHLSLILLAIWQVKQRPIITIGVAWFVLSVLLFSNWTELVAGMVGERLAFTASAGFSILFAGIVMWIKPNFSFTKPKGIELIVFAVLLLFAARTIARNSDWKDSLTLMGHDIKHLSNSAQANNLYASALMKEAAENNQMGPEVKQNYRLKGIEHFKKAITIYPKFYNANYDLGRAYIEVGDFANAKLAFEQTYKIDPENLLALEELTKTSFDLKQKEETEYYGNMYLERDPNNENIYELLAYIMLINNEKVKAKAYAERGLKYFSNNQNLYQILIDSSK